MNGDWLVGNAQFVVIDSYWYYKNNFVPVKIWNWSLGKEQYRWLVETLRESNATFKFVFSHQVISNESDVGRGGIEFMDGEWATDADHFAANRPDLIYNVSVHDLMAEFILFSEPEEIISFVEKLIHNLFFASPKLWLLLLNHPPVQNSR